MSGRARRCRFCGGTEGDLLAEEPVVTRGWCGSPTRTTVARHHATCLARAEECEREATDERARLYAEAKAARKAGDHTRAEALLDAADDVKVRNYTEVPA